MATKRNALGVLMGIELVLNGANLNFIAFGSPYLRKRCRNARPRRPAHVAVRDRAGRGRGGRRTGHRAEFLQQFQLRSTWIGRTSFRARTASDTYAKTLPDTTADRLAVAAGVVRGDFDRLFGAAVPRHPRPLQHAEVRGLHRDRRDRRRLCAEQRWRMFGYWLPAHPLAVGRPRRSGTHAKRRPCKSRRSTTPRSKPSSTLAKRPTPPSTTTARRPTVTGDWYTLGVFGKLKLTIGYYIDTLTVVDVLHGDADRLVHPHLRLRLHARRAARRTPTTR